MQEVVTKTNFVVTVCKNYVAIFAVCSFFRCVQYLKKLLFGNCKNVIVFVVDMYIVRSLVYILRLNSTCEFGLSGCIKNILIVDIRWLI